LGHAAISEVYLENVWSQWSVRKRKDTA
jgi:hypothetical protein